MRSIATPRVFLLALCFAAATHVQAGTAAARGDTGASGLVTVNSIQFTQVRDNNSNNPWMQISIDVTASSYAAGATPDAKRFLPDVTFTFTAAWGSRAGDGQRAQLSAAASATAKALALEAGTKTTILFFVAPEFLKMNGLTAGSAPTYYALQIAAAGQTVRMDPRSMASSNLSSDSIVESFLGEASQKMSGSQGAMMPSYDLPPLLYVNVLNRGSFTVPTYVRSGK